MKTIKSKNLTVSLKTNHKGKSPMIVNIGGVPRRIDSIHYYTDEGIIGSYNEKTKVDSQWMFRRLNGVLESAKLGKWKEDKKANDAFYHRA